MWVKEINRSFFFFLKESFSYKETSKKNNAGKNERRFGVILTPFLKEPLEKKKNKKKTKNQGGRQ